MLIPIVVSRSRHFSIHVLLSMVRTGSTRQHLLALTPHVYFPPAHSTGVYYNTMPFFGQVFPCRHESDRITSIVYVHKSVRIVPSSNSSSIVSQLQPPSRVGDPGHWYRTYGGKGGRGIAFQPFLLILRSHSRDTRVAVKFSELLNVWETESGSPST